MLTRTMAITAALCVAGAMSLGCGETHSTATGAPVQTASIRSALGANPHDVTGFLYDIECEGGFTYSEFVPLEDEMLPPWLDPNAGPEHFFSDLFSILPVGECKVTATPMQNPTTPSAECHPVSAVFEVVPGQTTEIVLMAQCDGEDAGAGDIVAGLNDPPVVIGLEFNPSKFIVQCEELTLTAMAEDPNGDAITYTWTVVTAPAGAVYFLTPVGPSASPSTTFMGQTPGFYQVTLTVTDTYGASTSLTFPIHVSDVPGLEICDQDQSHAWQADFVLDPNTECEDSKYLAIPSSGVDKIAVYDLDTLLPLPTSPWQTCKNPSRILMDANTDVVVSCRDDGQIRKHTRDGLPLWSTQLPGCIGARGAVINPQGRLFAACSSNGNFHELNPATGAVIDTLTIALGGLGDYLYGLTADGDGVYACSRGQQTRVTRIDVQAGLSVAWHNNLNCYGIAADGNGAVWISNLSPSALQKLDNATGAILASVPLAGAAYGTMVSPSGYVIAGMTSANQVARLDTTTLALTYHNVAPLGSGPHGVTVDVQGNGYSINLNSSTLTKIDLLGSTTSFGGTVVGDPSTTILHNPYGYSGDMTGAINQCLTSIQDTWESSVYDSGNPATEWLSVSWNATVPAGTSITFSYSVDGGAWNQFATALDVNPSGTYTFAPPPVGAQIQFRVLLSAPVGSVNLPVLGDLSVTYQ